MTHKTARQLEDEFNDEFQALLKKYDAEYWFDEGVPTITIMSKYDNDTDELIGDFTEFTLHPGG